MLAINNQCGVHISPLKTKMRPAFIIINARALYCGSAPELCELTPTGCAQYILLCQSALGQSANLTPALTDSNKFATFTAHRAKWSDVGCASPSVKRRSKSRAKNRGFSYVQSVAGGGNPCRFRLTDLAHLRCSGHPNASGPRVQLEQTEVSL